MWYLTYCPLKSSNRQNKKAISFKITPLDMLVQNRKEGSDEQRDSSTKIFRFETKLFYCVIYKVFYGDVTINRRVHINLF